ncbi:MAG TPA: hypothetical protein VHI13_08595 [Candidatus Kapabacteria bacterium]|nr:hypothetical protein [Candidatus Kapabacteria bacterium]
MAMRTMHFPFILASVLLATSAPLVSCNGTKAPDAKQPAQTPSPVQTPPPAETHQARSPEMMPSFDETVLREYARRAVAIPKRITDSIIKAQGKNIAAVQTELSRYLKRQDSIARISLSKQFNIPLDSINAIINRKNNAE